MKPEECKHHKKGYCNHPERRGLVCQSSIGIYCAFAEKGRK